MGIVKYIYGGNEQCCDRSLVEAIFRRQLRFPSWQNVRMYTYAWRLLGKHKLLDPRNQKLQNKRDKRNNTSLRRKVQKPLDSIAMGPCSQVKDLKSDCIQVLPERKQYTLKKKRTNLNTCIRFFVLYFFPLPKSPDYGMTSLMRAGLLFLVNYFQKYSHRHTQKYVLLIF